jgi:hypothetical protein
MTFDGQVSARLGQHFFHAKKGFTSLLVTFESLSASTRPVEVATGLHTEIVGELID